MCRQFDHLHAIHRLPVIVRLALKEIKNVSNVSLPLTILRNFSFFLILQLRNFAFFYFLFEKVDNYPRAIILSRFHHQRRGGRVRLMSGESGYGGRMYAHARRVQGYGLLSTAVRCARNLWTDYARRVFDNLCIGWQAYTS